MAGGTGNVTLYYRINGTLPAGLSFRMVGNTFVVSGTPSIYDLV